MPSYDNHLNNTSFYYIQVIPSLLVRCDELKLQALSVEFYGAISVQFDQRNFILTKACFIILMTIQPTIHLAVLLTQS